MDTAFFARGASPVARDALRFRLDIASKTKLVLLSGKLLPFKRPLDVVTAVSRVRSAEVDAAVLVAGSGPLEADMRAHAKALAVPLHILGFQNQSRMPAAYSACDLLELPSDGRETWGLVCDEALACGRPIVVSSAAGCAEDLVTVDSGAVFASGDMSGAAQQLMADIALDTPPREAARLSDEHSVEAAASGIVAALRAAARQGGPQTIGDARPTV